MDGSASASLFRMEGVSKRYGGVNALTNADLTVEAGRIHGVLGENGAGKSTLMKVMAGVVQPDEGRMTLAGSQVRFANPAAANAAGIVCIFQELSLVPDLSVADNICISNPPKRFGLIDQRAQRRMAEEALARAGGEDIHPLAPVKDLPLSRRQLVEIAKALVRNPRILILDEATSALTAADVRKVFAVLKRLRAEGLALLYISHRMAEIAELADECTVFRNGRNVGTFKSGAKTDTEIVEMMIGREYSHVFPPKPAPKAETETPALEVRNLSWNNRLKDISLTARAGEIVGLGGLDGQGQRELLLSLFGVLRGATGEVLINGKKATLGSPNEAKRGDMALIPEDRKTEGLLLPMTVGENITLAALGGMTRGGVIDRKRESDSIARMVEALRIKIGSADAAVGTLSGGNQQKVAIAKWLLTEARIVLLNDPTRGIDVGTKQEIYQLLHDLAAAGTSILFYSTDYDELIGCCDRVLILYGGRVIRTLEGDAITETNIVASALNLETNDQAAEAVPA
jgi:ribose transport system ATP-binding protein